MDSALPALSVGRERRRLDSSSCSAILSTTRARSPMNHLVISTTLVIASSVWLAISDQSPPSRAALIIASTYLFLAVLVWIARWITGKLRLLRNAARKIATSSSVKIADPRSRTAPVPTEKAFLTESNKIEIASAAVSSGVGLAAFAASNGIKESSLREWVSSYLGQDSSNNGDSKLKEDVYDDADAKAPEVQKVKIAKKFAADSNMEGYGMDFSKLVSETIAAVKHAVRKEDESYGGEVLAERLSSGLVDAGVDIETRLGYAAWYGASDEVVVGLITAFLENSEMDDQDDAAISRIQSDLYDALQENGHLELSHPEFWQRAMARL